MAEREPDRLLAMFSRSGSFHERTRVYTRWQEDKQKPFADFLAKLHVLCRGQKRRWHAAGLKCSHAESQFGRGQARGISLRLARNVVGVWLFALFGPSLLWLSLMVV